MKQFGDGQGSDYCCSCKVHIRTGALVVTLLALAFGVCLTYRPTGVDDGLFGLISLLTSVLGLYAYCQRAAWAWLPITVWNACCTASHLLTAVMCLLLHVASYFDFQGVQDVMGLQFDRFTPQVFQVVTAVSAVILVLLAWLWVWFTMITYRAYKWQTLENTPKANNFVKVAV